MPKVPQEKVYKTEHERCCYMGWQDRPPLTDKMNNISWNSLRLLTDTPEVVDIGECSAVLHEYDRPVSACGSAAGRLRIGRWGCRLGIVATSPVGTSSAPLVFVY